MAIFKQEAASATVRGIVIDAAGLVVDELTWTDGEPQPKADVVVRDSKGKAVKILKRTVITDLAGFVSPRQRWDFNASGGWDSPPLMLYFVSRQGGNLVSSASLWPDEVPPASDQYVIVDDAPPAGSPIYNFTTETWGYPRRVAVLDKSGTVVDVLLENPDDAAPNYEAPDGYSVKRGGADGRLPLGKDGQEVAQGDKLVKGVWKAK
jgi:hypothetical protein